MNAFIFDLDGVLISTDRFHYLAWKKIAVSRGIYFDEVINNRLRGVSRAESLEIILELYDGDLTQEEKEQFLEEKNTEYRKLLDTLTPSDVSEEVRETLEELRRNNYKLAVGSSSKNAGYILEKTALTELFDAISDGNNICHSKPHPEVFLKACEYLKERPENCIIVEDAVAGIDAGKAANMTTVGIGDVSGYKKCDYGIQSIKELLKLCQGTVSC